MLKAILAFFTALPEIIKLINQMQKRIDEANIKRKVKHDIKAINVAFEEKDATALDNIFNR